MRHAYFDLPLPIVFGHRGASGTQPENTIPSFAHALEEGADVVETDVHRSRDGVVVVLHDEALERTTDGTGRVADTTWEDLRKLDAGHRFSPDGGRTFPERGRGIRIPSLREVFERFPGVRFNVEIKEDDPLLIAAALDLVEELDREEITLLAAEKDSTMAAIRRELAARELRPAMGASTGDVLAFVKAAVDGTPPPPEPMALQVPASILGRPLVTPELVSFAHAHDVQVHVWTVNETEEMERLLALGVDGVMSDFPGRLRQVVDRIRAAGQRGGRG